MAGLSLRQIVKRFGNVTAIHGVDLDVADGEFVVVVGPSGCGKSTLLRIIAGLEEASEGDILIDGKRVNTVSAAARGLAMVFQSYALYPHMSVYQNLAFGLENLGTKRGAIQAKVSEAAKLLRLDALLDRRPGQLSGGQRQRVAIGRAIVRDPTIFLFDEPLSNLDAELRVQMRAEITALHKRLGTTMIYVTHDQVEAMTMAGRIVVLRAGRVEQCGTPLDLYNRPANRFVAGFIGSPQMNFLKGTLSSVDVGIRVACDAAGAGSPDEADPHDATPITPSRRVTIGIRPEHIVIGELPDASLSLSAIVDRIEQLGAVSFLYCSLPRGETLTIHAPGQAAHRAGDRLKVGFPRSHTHIFDIADGERALAGGSV